jgi:hypothetical protein
MCVAEQDPHRVLLGRTVTALAAPRGRRDRPQPYRARTPPHSGQANSPAARLRSITTASSSTVIKASPGAPRRPFRLRDQTTTGGPSPCQDMITVPPGAPKINPFRDISSPSSSRVAQPAPGVLVLSRNQHQDRPTRCLRVEPRGRQPHLGGPESGQVPRMVAERADRVVAARLHPAVAAPLLAVSRWHPATGTPRSTYCPAASRIMASITVLAGAPQGRLRRVENGRQPDRHRGRTCSPSPPAAATATTGRRSPPSTPRRVLGRGRGSGDACLTAIVEGARLPSGRDPGLDVARFVQG